MSLALLKLQQCSCPLRHIVMHSNANCWLILRCNLSFCLVQFVTPVWVAIQVLASCKKYKHDLILDKAGIRHTGKAIKSFLLFHHFKARRPHIACCKEEMVISESNLGPQIMYVANLQLGGFLTLSCASPEVSSKAAFKNSEV